MAFLLVCRYHLNLMAYLRREVAVLDYLSALEEFSDTCIRCGLCARTDCGNYGDGWCLGEVCEGILNGDSQYEHFPFTCALCNRCTVNCPVGLKAIDGMKPSRALLLSNKSELRPNYRHFRTDLRYNLFSMTQGVRKGDIEQFSPVEGELLEDDLADSTAFFPGCSLASYSPELTYAAFEWLRKEHIASRKLNICCGATFFDTGFFEEFKEYRVRLCDYLKSLNIKRLVIVCPHCGYELPQALEGCDIELLKLPELMVERNVKIPGTGTYSVHDACYDRLDGAYGKAVREMFSNWEPRPLAHEGENTICCGGGGMVSAYAPAYCEYRRNQRLAEIDSVESDVLVSTCFSCVNSMQRGQSSKPVRHYLELAFDVDIDWPEVYGSVNRMYADPKADGLLSDDEAMFEPRHD